MALPIVALGAIAIARAFLPDLVTRIAGDRSGRIAEQVIGVAEAATGLSAGEGGTVDRVIEALTGDDEKRLTVSASLAEIDAAERTAELQLAIVSVQETNATARDELKSSDWFIRHARPAAIWAAVFVAVLCIVVALAIFIVAPQQIGGLIDLLRELMPFVAVLTAIAGIYTFRRTDEKRAGVASGMPERIDRVL